MNLLQLVQTTLTELGLTAPNAAATSSDMQVIQMVALLNKVGRDIITDDQWQGLTKEYRFNTVVLNRTGATVNGSSIILSVQPATNGITKDIFMVSGDGLPNDTFVTSVDSPTQVTVSNPSQSTAFGPLVFTQVKYPLPPDYNYQINRTHWDKTNHWELMGPKSPQEWQYLKGGIVSTGPRIRYRIMDDAFWIWPTATVDAQLGYEYISNGWVIAADGTPKTSFTNDTDTCIFRDQTMIQGAKYEFFSIKGFDTTALSRDYYFQKDKEIARDKGAPTLSLSGRNAPMFIGPGSVPESGYGK